MFRKTKYHIEQSRKAQWSLRYNRNSKHTLEDMLAQLKRTTPKEIPLNWMNRRLHDFLLPTDYITDMKALSHFISAGEDKEHNKKLRSLLKGDLRN